MASKYVKLNDCNFQIEIKVVFLFFFILFLKYPFGY